MIMIIYNAIKESWSLNHLIERELVLSNVIKGRLNGNKSNDPMLLVVFITSILTATILQKQKIEQDKNLDAISI